MQGSFKNMQFVEKKKQTRLVLSIVSMASWADEASGETSVDQENFKAERIISQTPDGREKVPTRGRTRVLCAVRRARPLVEAASRGRRVDTVGVAGAARSTRAAARGVCKRWMAKQERVCRPAPSRKSLRCFCVAPVCVQVKVITEIRKNEKGDRIKVERTVKVRCAPLSAVARGPSAVRLGA